MNRHKDFQHLLNYYKTEDLEELKLIMGEEALGWEEMYVDEITAEIKE